MSGFEGSDIRTMVMFGQGEDATYWVDESSRADVTKYVLFPAASYGQLNTLKKFIHKGDPWLVDTDKDYVGWNLYHYAVNGYQNNCSYLVTSVEPNPNLPSTFEEAREKQLDIIHALAEGDAMPFDPRNPDLNHRPPGYPPHPSQMALEPKYNFLEAAYLIDILVILKSDPDLVVPTPGLEIIKVSKKKEYSTALCHLMKWSYHRGYLNVLGYCHDRYYSICGDILRLEPGNLPIFLHAVTTSNLDVIQLVFDHVEKRPVPDRLMSKVYKIGPEETASKASAISLTCEASVSGNAALLQNLIGHVVIGNHLVNISLSDLQLTQVPLALFHKRLNSLSLSENRFTTLPPVAEWACKDLMFLSLEHNQFERLPPGLFTLAKLHTLNVSNNKINQLEPSLWSAPSLKTLHLNKNCLKSLPCPPLPKASVPDAGTGNPNQTVSNQSYQVFSIGQGFMNRGVQRSGEQYETSRGGYNLQFLDLSDNQLESVPEGLACLAPQLKTLKLSRNRIRDFGKISNYPSVLKSLELIRNGAVFSISGQGVTNNAVRCYQSQPGNVVNCYHRTHGALSSLHHLNMSKNNLPSVDLEQIDTAQSPLLVSSLVSSVSSPNLLFPHLQSLSIGSNKLTHVPGGIHKLTSLLNLDISYNELITHIPLKLYHLKELDGFQYKGVSDPIVHQLDNCKDIGRIRHFLRARQTETVVNSRMRLNIIGHHKKGKSSVLRCLHKYGTNNRKGTEFSLSLESSLGAESSLGGTDVQGGMYTHTWVYNKKKTANNQFITFCTWKFGGKNEFYPVNQCFLSNRAMYILVWKATDREPGVNGLGTWLRMLQTKAPRSQVIIVGTHIDQISTNERTSFIRSYTQTISEMYGKSPNLDFPTIRKIHFIGQEETGFAASLFSNIASENQRFVDSLFDEATKMEIPKTQDMKPNYHMKILEEQLPKTYLQIEEVVNELRDIHHLTIIPREEFCELPKVKRVIDEASEVNAAMDYLHDRGTLFHFHIKALEDVYILDTQWWFKACELVVSSENIGSLFTSGDSSSGILNYENMSYLFSRKGIDKYTTHVFQFLHQHEVILPIDAQSALVPSFLYHTPMFKLAILPGVFPFSNKSLDDGFGGNNQMLYSNFGRFVAAAANKSLPSDVKINRTGLVLRRMFFTPPLGLEFWNRIINLCLQKDDFATIIREAFDEDTQVISSDHGQLYQIGRNCQLRLKYWKSGIVLDLNHQTILHINSVKSDDFTDPMEESAVSETSLKAKRFNLVDEDDGLFSLNNICSEVFEVVVVDINIHSRGEGPEGGVRPIPISAKLLTKSLEMIDEVLRGYSNDIAEDGIYSLNQLFHVTPCPICFGDADNRPREHVASTRSRSATGQPRSGTGRRMGSGTRKAWQSFHSRRQLSEGGDSGGDTITVFSLDQCIEAVTNGIDYIECPSHGKLKLDYLAPDIDFNDLSNLKLNISQLTNPVGNDGTPVGQGCFGKVYHKLLNHMDSYDRPVAVKEFIVDSMMGTNEEMDDVKKYSDMRYEINKLSVLNHDYIVRFVGVVSRPPSFVLEWAPLMSLEKIRANHERHRRPICPVSLYITLLQVLDGLHYLHAPPVGIIHSDLKLSNILAFRFPSLDHICCYAPEDRGRCVQALPELSECGILVKLGDMGVCINPTGHNAGDNLGVKRFSPECNTPTEKKLTEKVDIFCLGICVYELLTLKGLPPEDYTEIEYRRMLAKGWRPLFHSKDINYPLSLQLFLEQCWEQDYTHRPSAKVLKSFLEALTEIKVENKFEVQPDQLSMKHCIDGFMLASSDQEVTAIHMVTDRVPLLIYMAVSDQGVNKVVSLESVEDDESKKPFFKSKVINQIEDDKVTAIDVSASRDVILGYSSGLVIYLKAKGAGYPQSTPANVCSVNIHHGKLNYIKYVHEEDMVITGFDNGIAHLMKIQAETFTDTFLRGFYCCKKENPDLAAVGSFVVVINGQQKQLEVWCGCNNGRIETWNFALDSIVRLMQSTVTKTTSEINLRHPNYTTHSCAVYQLSITPDKQSVFALIGDSAKHDIMAISQINATTKEVLRHWQCDIGKVSHFSTSMNDLIIGTRTGQSLVYSRSKLEQEDVHEATCDSRVFSHLSTVSQAAVYDGAIDPEGYTSMFHTYLGSQGASTLTPCRYVVSVGRGFVTPLQFDKKAPKNSANERNGYCINVWAV